MGGCSSGGNVDKELDMYTEKFFKRKHISTPKDCYEVSKQHFKPESQTLKGVKLSEMMLIEDEIS